MQGQTFARSRLLALVLVTAIPCAAAPAAGPVVPAVGPVPEDQFEALHRMIRPQPTESRFWDIPWELDVQQARRRAVAEGKPILVWGGAGGPPIGTC